MLLMVLLCFVAESQCMQGGHYMLNFDSPVYVCEGEELIDCSGLVCERHNESTAVMYGQFEFRKEMDPKLILVVILKKETNGKLEVLFSHDICDLCKEVDDGDSAYKRYMKHIGIPSCPFHAGVFKIHNLIIDVDEFGIQDHQCGPYMAELYLYKSTGENCQSDRELIAVLKVDVSVEQR